MALELISEPQREDLSAAPSVPDVHCVRCGRKLTAPKSVREGIGPKCARTVAYETRAFNQRQQAYSQQSLAYLLRREEKTDDIITKAATQGLSTLLPVIEKTTAPFSDEYWSKRDELLKTQKSRVTRSTQTLAEYFGNAKELPASYWISNHY